MESLFIIVDQFLPLNSRFGNCFGITFATHKIVTKKAKYKIDFIFDLLFQCFNGYWIKTIKSTWIPQWNGWICNESILFGSILLFISNWLHIRMMFCLQQSKFIKSFRESNKKMPITRLNAISEEKNCISSWCRRFYWFL